MVGCLVGVTYPCVLEYRIQLFDDALDFLDDHLKIKRDYRPYEVKVKMSKWTYFSVSVMY